MFFVNDVFLFQIYVCVCLFSRLLLVAWKTKTIARLDSYWRYFEGYSPRKEMQTPFFDFLDSVSYVPGVIIDFDGALKALKPALRVVPPGTSSASAGLL